MSEYRSNEYRQMITEYFDITDSETRSVMMALNEEDQGKAILSLTSKLYDNIVEKVDDINFGDIPATKGDATALPQYEKIRDCIKTMNELMIEFKQDGSQNMVISEALDNLVSRKEMFEKAYKMNVELPIVIYETIYLAIVSAMSLMISSCVEFIKQPTNDTFTIVVDKVGLAKSKDNLLFNNLKKFNTSCRKGQIDRGCDYVIRSNIHNFAGLEVGVFAGAVAIGGILLNIIPIIRELIFFFFYVRTRVSDYFEAQADLLQMNAYNVQANTTLDTSEREKISKKQLSIADMFRKLANKLTIDGKESEVKTIKDISNNNKKFKSVEVFDELPDSGASALF